MLINIPDENDSDFLSEGEAKDPVDKRNRRRRKEELEEEEVDGL